MSSKSLKNMLIDKIDLISVYLIVLKSSIKPSSVLPMFTVSVNVSMKVAL